ncbi:FtsX-like permease family protein [Zobellia galactanivorans]|uniref:ABC transporter permease n=1 Tax=Zobellia TaxID=112040 RepID=UPI000B52D103|nr:MULTISPECIES: FtsX-like permease family protein [Zobellia]MBU3026756.1 FtsX-like permease family protein [Zobellia galactanivorans]MDO6809096.1 FtsX-like permease family protein [Zobellia galactanivorans]OWW26750.1 ABC transporter permease [Zobellia sp. OII3]
MNFPFYIAKRYVRSKSSQNAVNVINFITFLVTVIGSAALFIVLSGFAGLKSFSLSFSNTFDPDLKALPATGKFFSVSPEQEAELAQIEGLAFYSKELEEKVYLKHREKGHIAFIKGIDTNYTHVTGIDSTLLYGTWRINSQEAVAGIGITNILGLTINQYQNPLVVLALKPGKGSLTQKSLKTKALVLSGVYSVEENLDKKYVFADLPSVQQLLEKKANQVSGVNFKVQNVTQLGAVKSKIAAVFGNKVVLKDRQELNSTLHRMLNTENLATYLIFTLVLGIALFNVVGAIIMMILDKLQNLKTLYSLGTTLKELRRIYFMQGVLVTGLGGFIGVVFASLLIWSQLAFGWLKITPSLAYPVEYQWINVLIVFGTIFILGIIASKIASSRITKKMIAI